MSKNDKQLKVSEGLVTRAQILSKLKEADHDWFNARYGIGNKEFDVSTLSLLDMVQLTVGGKPMSVALMYMPVVLWSLNPIADLHLPVEQLRPLIADLFDGNAELCLVENLKSVTELASLDPVDVYGLGQEAAVSVLEDTPMSHLIPFDPVDDVEEAFGGYIYRATLLAAAVLKGNDCRLDIRATYPKLGSISGLLSLHYKPGPNQLMPLAYVGFPSPYSNFMANQNMVNAFAVMDLVGMREPGEVIELRLGESLGPYSVEYDIEVDGRHVASITVPNWRAEELERYLRNQSAKYSRAYRFAPHAGPLH